MSFSRIARHLRTRPSWPELDADEEREAEQGREGSPPLIESEDAPPSAPLEADGDQDITTERVNRFQDPQRVVIIRWIAR
jgi:hypothetical protein